MELRLQPRPSDGIDRPISLLSQPIQHYKTDGQARIHLGREESKYGRRFSLMALLVHPAPRNPLKKEREKEGEWPSIFVVVESWAIRIDQEVLKYEVGEELIYQRNIISKTLEEGRELSRTGSKHDGIEARRENPKLDKNPNFSIMQVFDEAEGSGNICRQENYRKDRNQANGPRSSRRLVAWVQNVVSTIQQAECLQKLELAPCMEAVRAA
ncbi:hypothetical protein F2Q70_00036047 [Brassica cretica]|uniref:Uncharacterized protein n=1 Tax=Brassica cretica TaxID=69181 RepID=A0A8S9JQS9_BRACR|nr:hypothetical protein F2Q70_00036047 [Brassica cretica]